MTRLVISWRNERLQVFCGHLRRNECHEHMHRAVFPRASNGNCVCCGVVLLHSVIGQQNSRLVLNQWETNARRFLRLASVSSNCFSDWLIALFWFIVIGWNICFGFGKGNWERDLLCCRGCSLTWPVAILVSWKKRKILHKTEFNFQKIGLLGHRSFLFCFFNVATLTISVYTLQKKKKKRVTLCLQKALCPKLSDKKCIYGPTFYLTGKLRPKIHDITWTCNCRAWNIFRGVKITCDKTFRWNASHDIAKRILGLHPRDSEAFQGTGGWWGSSCQGSKSLKVLLLINR